MARLTSSKDTPRCVIDRNVLNEDTVGFMENIGLSVFATLCGNNRGAFVLDPPDGNTYGCLVFPDNFAVSAGVETKFDIHDANSINDQFQDGNITASDAVELLDVLTKSVYQSSPNVDEDPYACNVGGLAGLECDRQVSLLGGSPIRAVTLAGVFVPAHWATGGKTLSLEQAKTFYTAQDFADMQNLGLNAVQIPVPLAAFASDADGAVVEALGDLMDLAQLSKLQAILVLVGQDDAGTVASAASFAAQHQATLAITLPSKDSKLVAAVRSKAPSLPVFLPVEGDDLKDLYAQDDNVYAALDMTHTLTVGDVASSTSQDDRMKLFYHEATSCISRSPIEYATCYRNVPVFVSTGFDLAIDDCVNKGADAFKDYGQCDRFDETVDSGWWATHRKSFAERQVFAYEQGLGWTFATWKLYGEDDNFGEIDSPVKLLALREVAAAGLMPSLTDKAEGAVAISLACLNPPEPDFVLGDDTLAPTAGPPPDCGNGWWNATTAQCDFWVPPPEPTLPPTEPCPVCAHTNAALAKAAGSGAAVALVLGAALLKLFSKGREGYTQLPS